MKAYKSTMILPNGRSIEETERLHNERIKAVYVEYWSKGIAPKYRDERCIQENEFVAVNQDGSENLVRLDLESREYTFIRKLTK